jgi:hypothetical protein
MKTKQFFEVIEIGQERTLGAVFCSDTCIVTLFFFQVEKNKISYSRQPLTSNTDTTSDSTSGKAFLNFHCEPSNL